MSAHQPLPPPPDVQGFSLDGTQAYMITAEQNRALCLSTGVEPSADGTAHPIYYFIATQIGNGRTVREFLDKCEFDVADGPMILGSAVTFNGPLKVDTPYIVRGELIGLTRKQSRTFGVMDVLEYRLALLDGDTELLEMTNIFALPRKEFT